MKNQNQALSASWHPDCLTCHHCDQPVADKGFSKVFFMMIIIITSIILTITNIMSTINITNIIKG